MNERDMMESSEEQISESRETSEVKAEGRGLEEATHEPGSRVEQIGSVHLAETIEATVKGLVDSSLSTDKLAGDQKRSADISEKVTQRELPEGGQKQKELQEQEDLEGILNGDFGSLLPGRGKLTDPYGKDKSGSGLGDEFGIDIGFDFDGNSELDGSSENDPQEEYPGAGLFGPGRGPGAGVVAEGSDLTEDEVNVMEMITAGASDSDIAAKESQLQDAALDDYEIAFGGEDGLPDPPPKSSTSSDSDEEGGRGLSPPSAEEVERVNEKTSGDEISLRDPDSPGEGGDETVSSEHADKLEAALDKMGELRHARKKAGSEVVTDPDQEDPGEELESKKDAT